MTYRTPRDPITGAPLHLTSDAVVMRVRYPENDADDDGRDIPSKIDRAEDYHTDAAGVTVNKAYNGGLEWSGGFSRYMRGVLPNSISEAKRVWRSWWELPAVVAHVQSRMPSEQFEAAMRFWRDGEEVEWIAAQMRHSCEWVQRAKNAAKNIVRRECLPTRLIGRDLPVFAVQIATKYQPTFA